MALTIQTLEAAVRAWVTTAIADASVPVIFMQQSAPRPVTAAGLPWVAIYLTGIEQPEWDSAEPLATHAITAVDQGARTFTVAGDRTLFYPAGGSVVVADSTGNDATYTIASSTFAGGSTTVTVTTAIPSAVADGVLTGARAVSGDRVLTFQIDALGADALQRAERIKSRLAHETVLAALADAGLAVYRSTPIRDLTGLLDTARESRASFSVRFGVESVDHEFVSTIERVTGTQVTLDSAGTTVRTDTLSVNMRDEPYAPG